MTNEKKQEMFREAGEACMRVANVVHDRLHEMGLPPYYIYRQTDVYDYQSDQWYEAFRKLAAA